MPCLCALTRVAARAITHVYEAELRATGLQAPQFWLLMELSHRDRTSQVELLKDVAMDQTTLSRNLAVLVRRKWVKSVARGRERRYSVTPAGARMRDRAQPKWKDAQDNMRAELGSDWDTVWNSLNRLIAASLEAEQKEKAK